MRWLWDTYAGRIRGFLRARGTPEVDEVVNDVFVTVFTGLDRFDWDSEAAFRAWLFRVAINKRVDVLRAEGRRPTPTGTVPDTAGPGDVEADVVAAIADVQLRSMLETLTPDQRDVIVLRFVADQSLETVAEALGKPVGAVKALQHRALAQLRKKFSG